MIKFDIVRTRYAVLDMFNFFHFSNGGSEVFENEDGIRDKNLNKVCVFLYFYIGPSFLIPLFLGHPVEVTFPTLKGQYNY